MALIEKSAQVRKKCPPQKKKKKKKRKKKRTLAAASGDSPSASEGRAATVVLTTPPGRRTLLRSALAPLGVSASRSLAAFYQAYFLSQVEVVAYLPFQSSSFSRVHRRPTRCCSRARRRDLLSLSPLRLCGQMIIPCVLTPPRMPSGQVGWLLLSGCLSFS